MLLTKVVALDTFTNTNFNIKNIALQLRPLAAIFVTLMKRSIFITPELLVRFEQNQRHSIGNEKVGIDSANKKSTVSSRLGYVRFST